MTSAYCDHAATTPMRPAAFDALADALRAPAANPTGAHGPARAARARLEAARESVAGLAGVAAGRVVFCSGGTEADNWAVAAMAARGPVWASAVEHPAVAEAVRRAGGGTIPVDANGVVDLDALADRLDASTGGVSVMWANNETGVIEPLAEVVAVVRERAPQAWVHTDAVQAFAKLPLDVAALGVDLVSVSAHKVGGPVGTGALICAEGVAPQPLLVGGAQETGRRAGTPDAAGAAAFAAAAAEACADDWARVAAVRDRFEAAVLAELDAVAVHAVDADRLGTHSHLGVAGVSAEMAVILLDRAGVAVSSGSSCASGAHGASPVLAAMGVSGEGALRFSFGWTSTDADVDVAVAALGDVVARLRATTGAA